MKRHFFKSVIIAITFLFAACAKENAEPEPEPEPIDKGSFTWLTFPGSAVNADSAHYYSQFNTIYAFKNGNTNSIEINLSSLSAGTYSISSVTGNSFEYISGSTTYAATSGSCTISAASVDKMSGTFNVNLSGGSVTGMSGSFSGIRKK